jgi:hypothetical protein
MVQIRMDSDLQNEILAPRMSICTHALPISLGNMATYLYKERTEDRETIVKISVG